MNADLGREQDFRGNQQNWEAVGGFLSTAIQEVALELGGEELAEKVALAAASEESLPNPAALEMLEKIQPGSAERTFSRMQEIQLEAHQRERAELRKQKFRRWGREILDGIAISTTFGSRPRKH